MTDLSTHVLDTAQGRPAAGLGVAVEMLVDGQWRQVSEAVTDEQGRVAELASDLDSGVYRLVFDTGHYGNPFYPHVPVVVNIEETQGHYHVPLLLSTYGYSTYRGS